MPKYRMTVPEKTISEYLYEVEADSPEEALEMVKNNNIEGTFIYTFSNHDGSDGRMWEDAMVVEVKK